MPSPKRLRRSWASSKYEKSTNSKFNKIYLPLKRKTSIREDPLLQLETNRFGSPPFFMYEQPQKSDLVWLLFFFTKRKTIFANTFPKGFVVASHDSSSLPLETLRRSPSRLNDEDSSEVLSFSR